MQENGPKRNEKCFFLLLKAKCHNVNTSYKTFWMGRLDVTKRTFLKQIFWDLSSAKKCSMDIMPPGNFVPKFFLPKDILLGFKNLQGPKCNGTTLYQWDI